MKKYIAELFGTFVLVFIGCGTVVVSAPYEGLVAVALAFGLAVMAMVYAIGPVSGAHLNPAVTLGMLCAKRMSLRESLGYIVFQFIGATLAAAVLYYMASGRLGGFSIAKEGLGQNGWGEDYAARYGLGSAILFEFVATFIFVKVILKVTERDLKIAGVVIGLTLTMLHILGLPITGVSVNPARSFGPAVFVGGLALTQLWMFLIVPTIAGMFAGFTSRFCCCNGACPLVNHIKAKEGEAEAKNPNPAHKNSPAHYRRGTGKTSRTRRQ